MFSPLVALLLDSHDSLSLGQQILAETGELQAKTYSSLTPKLTIIDA